MGRFLKSAAFAAVIGSLSPAAMAADALSVQLKSDDPVQSAGYLIAEARGFYAEEGLDVTLRPGGFQTSSVDALADGSADAAIEWMPAALVAREKGLPIVHVAQPFAASGLTLACLKESGVTTLARDLPGKTVGVAFQGDEVMLKAALNALNLNADAGTAGVTLLPITSLADPLRQKRADCVLTTGHGGLPALNAAGFAKDDLSVHPLDAGPLADGIYVLQPTLRDGDAADRLLRFVRASMKGWAFAAENPAEAASTLFPNSTAPPDAGQTTTALEDVLKLIASDWSLTDETADAAVAVLREGGDGAILHASPDEGAWWNAIMERLKPPPSAPQPQTP